ncbi:MAG TPA: bifunctional diaminohydroxyphosphoribosylaminopyrimidine deaminase/5-amino-6-(5-phosphoribosylamino)uracil reductase RibD, partial [Armatimonadetes bacterium]|nr:bifunctional diaminohydroxyphosphoribosylaminopyrimidine deaminase/5-amino-6-(5-phosphoribosylamino)uracil reductase RibD [Armatimonadota bacterium]
VKGATLYVNLEPCCHWGKTPPCVEAILQSGIEEVVIGNIDPNPQVGGKGIQFLREHGLRVRTGVLEAEGRELNRAYFKYHEEGLPFVTLKYAQSLDGRIATSTGDSRWISSERARRFAHRLRAVHDAVLVGIGTVLADDPQLTVRMIKGRNPLRVIIDSHLRIPQEAKVLQGDAPTLIATASVAPKEKAQALRQMGIEVVEVGGERVELSRLLKELASRGVLSLLVEGGQGVITSFLREGLADELVVIVAPLLIGRGVEAIGDLGVRTLREAKTLRGVKLRRIGQDWVLEAKLR